MDSKPALQFDADDIQRPTLVLDPGRVKANIERMAAKAEGAGVRLRPHFKTHQSAAIGGWFRERGVQAITVSSVRMARYFAEAGWQDITIAIPLNPRESSAVAELADEVSLGVLIDHEAPLQALADDLRRPVDVWIKIDTGYGRAGVRWDDGDRLRRLATGLGAASGLRYTGVLTHDGHSYHASARAEILAIHKTSVQRLGAARAVLDQRLGVTGRISIGDTPTCSVLDTFAGVDEIRPGNFVFYDLMQASLDVCAPSDIAVAVACPVISSYPSRGEILLHGGAVHLSKEALEVGAGRSVFGYISDVSSGGLGVPRADAPVISISQEHGIVRLPSPLLESVSIGDLVLVYPVHSCLACDLHDHYRTVGGEILTRL